MSLTHTPAWHTAQAADERAWLDQWVRAERTPECPWARPDCNVMADFTATLADMAATAGSPR
ncbi:hypothetical protein [Streptomyces sp. DHE17-7]|uniref:hypothetical protein n=1 Tax=Streptomyces sp. DHE17-7 TaxID=2759949 RepID=UPI0022EABA1C|nr:hypothetical protein [Streptomyces sp. DHE17-7]MBJ6623554.1 hypothetical protein [Streptomyces sp. DHE17-7]